tara:strand:- start:2376 stop:2741 length:366 start_codon:yes stop_codon:yes gene_type:complete
MKELDIHDQQAKDRAIEVLQKKKQKKEYKLINSLLPRKGHRIWEINEKTLHVEEASYLIHKEVSWWDAIKMISNPHYKKEIQIKTGHVYISALNAENALDRYRKDKGSAVRAEQVKSLKLW